MLKRDDFIFWIEWLIGLDVSILLMIRGLITLLIIDILLKLCFFLLYKFKKIIDFTFAMNLVIRDVMMLFILKEFSIM
jgi:hypothetical protein